MRSVCSLTLVLLLLLCQAAAAEEPAPTPSSVAPPVSFCVGKTFTCVVPDLNASFANYDLRLRKWSGGVSTVGAGYALLFFSDQPYALGPAVHASFSFSQAAPSYFSLTPTVVVFKYFEAGASFVVLDGDVKYFLSVGVSGNFEVLKTLATGKNIAERHRVATAAYRLRQSVSSP